MNKEEGTSNKMWGGRFDQGPAAIMTKINASIGFDQKLFAQDIEGSIAHCSMLVKQGIISATDGNAIIQGLEEIGQSIRAGTFDFSVELEDIHLNIEKALEAIIGPIAGRLHTARSRNDQVATDVRLYVRDAIDDICPMIRKLQLALATQAQHHAEQVMPGFTHLQIAQPVTFGHHLLAYVEMLERDHDRFMDARKRLNYCPLGAAALAGTSFPIDREYTAKKLGFTAPTANSMDSVADRDFILEVLAAASILSMHVSRFSEELVIFASSQFDFIRLSDGMTTGSSIMPQKRNPDAAELSRAKVGRISGAFLGLLVVMKGLPLTYSKDMQEDKEPLFEALDHLELIIAATTEMVKDFKINPHKMKQAAQLGYSTATDLADWLVQNLHMPFRRAHHVTGKIVRLAEENNIRLDELSIEQMRTIEPEITEGVKEVLSVEHSVASRTSYGGTAPRLVRQQAEAWLKKLG